MARPHLRPLQSDSSERSGDGEGRVSHASAPPDSPRWVPVALALALVLTLALLVWSRLQMGDQISQLETEISELQSQVSERDDLILAQDRRISDVRTEINKLHDLVNQPLD